MVKTYILAIECLEQTIFNYKLIPSDYCVCLSWQVTPLLGGQLFIDSSGSGVGQLLVNQKNKLNKVELIKSDRLKNEFLREIPPKAKYTSFITVFVNKVQ